MVEVSTTANLSTRKGTHLASRNWLKAVRNAAIAAALTAAGAGGYASSDPAAPPVIQEAAPLPVAVSPADRSVRYSGRFQPGLDGYRCAWPACEAAIRFQASAVNFHLKETSNNDEYEIFVDGVPTAVMIPSPGDHLYRLVDAEDSAPHSLEVVKRTETFFGVATFEGFQLAEGGKLLKPARYARKIEVIGDSISCGYGDEAASQNEHFNSKTENASLAYGAIASRMLGADYYCVAWSGKLMWPKNTLPEIYDLTIAVDSASAWDFSQYAPDVVVINLSTNDFNKGAPDQAGWTAAYEAFIDRVRGHYPHAAIYCAMSPMMYGKASDTLAAYLAQVIGDEKRAGDSNVRLMPFKTQDASKGLGADWHPNLENQRIIAQTMADRIAADLGWKPQNLPIVAVGAADLLSLPTISLAANDGVRIGKR